MIPGRYPLGIMGKRERKRKEIGVSLISLLFSKRELAFFKTGNIPSKSRIKFKYNSKMKLFWKVSIAKNEEKKKCQIFIFHFQGVDINITC
jgi:hypothetical protein